MKAIVSKQKPESSVKDCLRKCNQTNNSMLINSYLTKKFLTENSKMLLINLNESNILQVYFVKMARTVLGFPLFFLILALNCKKSLLLLSKEAVIHNFLHLSNLSFYGLGELLSLLVLQNMSCFSIHTYGVYLVESIP